MQIQWQNAGALDPRDREHIEAHLQRLANEQADLIDIRIVVRTTRHHRHGGHEVRIICMARGREIVASRTRLDLWSAAQDSVHAFEREVRRLRDRWQTRRSERVPESPYLGIVDRVFRDRDYGFILTDDGEEVYFHRNAVQGELDFDKLEEGQRVGLNREEGREGLQATAVVLPSPGLRSL